LEVRFTELHRMVTELPVFADNPKTSNEAKLEAIQMAWYEEWIDRKE
jgi:FeS assembly protein IscX